MLRVMDELLSIGRFSRLAGLSIGALRHYHELDLLIPARVDPETSYRSYARSQLEDARLIARLRELDLSLPQIRAVIGADPAERQRLLVAHRARLTALLTRTQRQIHWLNRTIDHEEPIMTETPVAAPTPLDAITERQVAVDLFNHVWTLLETPERTSMQDDEMLHAAHASRHHWGNVGKPVNLARGEWQCSRVYAVLGRPEPALWHGDGASRCARSTGSATSTSRSAGRRSPARRAWPAIDRPPAKRSDRARKLSADIGEEEDRELLLSDLATISVDEGGASA